MTKEDLLASAQQHLRDPMLSLQSLYQEHPNWSSLTALMLVSDLSSRYGVLVSTEALRQSPTLEALSAQIKQPASPALQA